MKNLTPLQIRKRINKLQMIFNDTKSIRNRIGIMEDVLIKKQIQYHNEHASIGCNVIIDDKF